MIFASLGTHTQPFERAIKLLSVLDGSDEMVIQHGVTPVGPSGPHTAWVEHLDWEDFSAMIRAADVVICHAGAGTIVTAIRSGHRPVLLPRFVRFGEHVDDHQLQICERLADRGLAFVLTPGADLTALVAASRAASGTAAASEARTALASRRRFAPRGQVRLAGAVAAAATAPSGVHV